MLTNHQQIREFIRKPRELAELWSINLKKTIKIVRTDWRVRSLRFSSFSLLCYSLPISEPHVPYLGRERYNSMSLTGRLFCIFWSFECINRRHFANMITRSKRWPWLSVHWSDVISRPENKQLYLYMPLLCCLVLLGKLDCKWKCQCFSSRKDSLAGCLERFLWVSL